MWEREVGKGKKCGEPYPLDVGTSINTSGNKR
jgi:hypothetical protein